MKKKGLGGWVTGALMIAGICYAASYSLPYIKGIFYDPMMEATGATNTQLGLIMSVYGFGNVIFNLIGGFVTDKLDYKKCIIVSLLGTTALSVWLALAPSVINMYIIWGLFGVTTFFVFNPSIFKLPRMIVPEHLVGESVGMFSFAQSIGYMVINFTSLYVYNLAEKSVGQVPAFSTVVWVYAGFTFVSALGCIFIFRKVEDVNTEGDENEKFTFSQLALVMKEPGLWMMIICGFCMFSTMATTSYFVPYFNDVFGVAVTFSGVLGVLNLYGGRLFSPILGKIATKTKYVSRMVIFGTSALIVFLICILLFSAKVPLGVLVAVFSDYRNRVYLIYQYLSGTASGNKCCQTGQRYGNGFIRGSCLLAGFVPAFPVWVLAGSLWKQGICVYVYIYNHSAGCRRNKCGCTLQKE